MHIAYKKANHKNNNVKHSSTNYKQYVCIEADSYSSHAYIHVYWKHMLYTQCIHSWSRVFTVCEHGQFQLLMLGSLRVNPLMQHLATSSFNTIIFPSISSRRSSSTGTTVVWSESWSRIRSNSFTINAI